MQSLFSSTLRRVAARSAAVTGPNSTHNAMSRRSFSPEQMASLVLGSINKKKGLGASSPKSSSAVPAPNDASARSRSTVRGPVHHPKPLPSRDAVTFSLPPAGTRVEGEPLEGAQSRVGRSSRTNGGGPSENPADYPAYVCKCCATPLFSLCPTHCSVSSSVGSHVTGWPSFIRPVLVDAVAIGTTHSIRSMVIEGASEVDGKQTPRFGNLEGVLDGEDHRNRGEFRADSATVANAAPVPVQTKREIRRLTSNIPYDEFNNVYEKRLMENSCKVATRLWKGSRGDAGHSNTLFVGKCAACKEDVCYVTMPSGQMPSYIVSAKKVRCVAPAAQEE